MNIKPGDAVTIRAWESLANEFGAGTNDGIKVNDLLFTHEMVKHCGKVYTVAYVGKDDFITCEFGPDHPHLIYFNNDMTEEFCQGQEQAEDLEAVKQILKRECIL